MYTLVLALHSWLRWLALIAGIAATVTALSDRASTAPRRADLWGLALMVTLDMQMLIGLLLYFVLSPFTAEAMRDFGAAMRNSGLRFFAVEHLTLMLGAFVVVMTVSIVLLRSTLLTWIGGRGVPSRTEPLIGRQGIVTHDIDPTRGTGRITVGGEDWAARCSEPLPTGTTVRVAGADGIVLEVTRT